jgi:hypothetical protein
MNSLIKVTALAAILSASAAFAQNYPAPEPSAKSSDKSADYSKLDVNGDGSISKDEAKKDPTLSAKFSELDTDKSGSLTTAELSAGMSKDQ